MNQAPLERLSPPPLVLLNSHAGSVRNASVSLPQEVERLFKERGATVRIVPARSSDLERRARDAVAEGVSTVIAAGGDGTVNTVARVLSGTDVAMGVLPLGTFNLFSRACWIPQDLPGAVDAVARGVRRQCDIGEVNGRLFLMNSLIGLYPEMVRRREQLGYRNKPQKYMSMTRAVFDVFTALPTLRLGLFSEELEEVLNTPCIFVGANRSQLSWRGLLASNFNEGCLTLSIVRSTGRMRLLETFLRVLLDYSVAEDTIQTTHVEECRVVSPRKRSLRVTLDGEVCKMKSPLHYRIRKKALTVLVPRERADAPFDSCDANDR